MIRMIFNLLLGKNIIIYKENSKEVFAVISPKESILKKGYGIDYGKYVTDNNGEIRYIKK